MAVDKEELVQRAKLAEQAERYDDMVNFLLYFQFLHNFRQLDLYLWQLRVAQLIFNRLESMGLF